MYVSAVYFGSTDYGQPNYWIWSFSFLGNLLQSFFFFGSNVA